MAPEGLHDQERHKPPCPCDPLRVARRVESSACPTLRNPGGWRRRTVRGRRVAVDGVFVVVDFCQGADLARSPPGPGCAAGRGADPLPQVGVRPDRAVAPRTSMPLGGQSETLSRPASVRLMSTTRTGARHREQPPGSTVRLPKRYAAPPWCSTLADSRRAPVRIRRARRGRGARARHGPRRHRGRRKTRGVESGACRPRRNPTGSLRGARSPIAQRT